MPKCTVILGAKRQQKYDQNDLAIFSRIYLDGEHPIVGLVHFPFQQQRGDRVHVDKKQPKGCFGVRIELA